MASPADFAAAQAGTVLDPDAWTQHSSGRENSLPWAAEEPAAIEGLGELWTETRGSSEITIAVLDGPVDLGHPAFRGADLRVLETLVRGGADRGPASRHGTHLASLIFGQQDRPVRGVAPRCRGLIVPIFESAGE